MAVHAPGLIVVAIANTGNVAIKPEDFQAPLVIATRERTAVLEAAVASTEPPELFPYVHVSQPGQTHNRVKIENLLLNPRDIITIRLLVHNFEPEVRVEGRITNVSRSRQVNAGRGDELDRQFAQLTVTAAILTVVFSASSPRSPRNVATCS
jgi:hypothetical protein